MSICPFFPEKTASNLKEVPGLKPRSSRGIHWRPAASRRTSARPTRGAARGYQPAVRSNGVGGSTAKPPASHGPFVVTHLPYVS